MVGPNGCGALSKDIGLVHFFDSWDGESGGGEDAGLRLLPVPLSRGIARRSSKVRADDRPGLRCCRLAKAAAVYFELCGQVTQVRAQ